MTKKKKNTGALYTLEVEGVEYYTWADSTETALNMMRARLKEEGRDGHQIRVVR